ncbi:hypothetical protein Pfo_011402 [Paulownia fortunei]|nr:hypothetical protein Pfo_011402 [Paulownia fortunei]
MAVAKGKKPHVLAVPFPAQGHVTPLMKLSRLIASLGIKVTFVNTEYIHEKILASALSDQQEDSEENNNIVLTSIPDRLAPEDDRNDGFKLLGGLKSTMASALTDLIEKINCSNSDEKISCIIADITVGWILEIAEEMAAEPVGFTLAAAASLAVILHIPKLIEQGNLDIYGSVMGCDTISLSDNIPPWRKNELSWSFPIDLKTQKNFFESCDLNPKLLPVGPLLNTNNSKSAANSSSSFRPEDTSCLSWLNEKPVASVIYVSFGSLAVFSQHQLDELALGLELSGRPFLWVVRSDLANCSRAEYPKGFLERVLAGGLGKIVEWAPQEKVLSHPCVACFLSHCGWNSTVEGLSRGVPFLCWPYFADQFHNQNYICQKWKTGLRIDPDQNGVRTRHEIKTKIQMLFSDDNLKTNALIVKAMAAKSVDQWGSSSKNFQRFIDHLKE